MPEKYDNAQVLENMKKLTTELCSFGHRSACSPAEKKDADHMAAWFTTKGFSVDIQRFVSVSSPAWPLLIHLLCALLGFMLISCCPLLSLCILSFCALSFYGEFTTRWSWLRRLLSKSISQNVIACLPAENPKRTLIFCSRLDAPRESLLYKPSMARLLWTPVSRFGVHAAGLLFLGILVEIALIKAFGGASSLLDLFIVLMILFAFVLFVLLVDSLLGRQTQGASGAASVAALAAMAEKIADGSLKRDETEYYFVSFGAGQTGSGALEFLAEFRHRFEPRNTYVINLGPCASGNLYYVDDFDYSSRLRTVRSDPELLMSARSLAAERGEFEDVKATSEHWHMDTIAFSQRGYKLLSLISLEPHGVPANFAWRDDTPENLDWKDAEKTLKFAGEIVARIK